MDQLTFLVALTPIKGSPVIASASDVSVFGLYWSYCSCPLHLSGQRDVNSLPRTPSQSSLVGSDTLITQAPGRNEGSVASYRKCDGLGKGSLRAPGVSVQTFQEANAKVEWVGENICAADGWTLEEGHRTFIPS